MPWGEIVFLTFLNDVPTLAPDFGTSRPSRFQWFLCTPCHPHARFHEVSCSHLGCSLLSVGLVYSPFSGLLMRELASRIPGPLIDAQRVLRAATLRSACRAVVSFAAKIFPRFLVFLLGPVAAPKWVHLQAFGDLSDFLWLRLGNRTRLCLETTLWPTPALPGAPVGPEGQPTCAGRVPGRSVGSCRRPGAAGLRGLGCVRPWPPLRLPSLPLPRVCIYSGDVRPPRWP